MRLRCILGVISGALIFLEFFSGGCSTAPPNAPDNVEWIIGNDSTIEVKYSAVIIGLNTTVLIEDFANVSCVPCVISNKILESLTRNTFGHGTAAVIKFPTNFPSPNDPFYIANPAVCEARRSFYNIFTAPTNIIDGLLKPLPSDSNDVKDKIIQRLAAPSGFKITVKDSISGEIYFIKFTVEINDTSVAGLNNLTCNIVITEDEIEFSVPPGSNGETRFSDVMRFMFPSDKQSFNLNKNKTASVLNIRQIVIDPKWNRQKLHTIIFLQDKSTKEIFQAASTFTSN